MSKLSEILSSPAVRNSRGLMVALVVSGLSIFAVVSMTGRVYLAYDHQQQINAQSSEMRQTIKDLSGQADEINKQKYRPVEEKQVPSVQSPGKPKPKGDAIYSQGPSEEFACSD